MRVACIGECMVELRELRGGTFQRSHGGDTLNTAVYLARLGVTVDYVTALGDDPWSRQMLDDWRAEGIGTDLVQVLPGQLPGLYVIQTDDAGERRFLYWRSAAAARLLFDHLDPAALARFDVLYLSGITLSIYDDQARATLFAALAAARERSATIVFDTNFRPRNWPDPDIARALYEQIYACCSIVLASVEDLDLLDPAGGTAALLRHAATAEIVLKLASPASLVHADGAVTRVIAGPVDRVVDTTAAGDSFAAGYLAARLRGAPPAAAARAGHALAGQVVGHPGAIMPPHAMLPVTTEGAAP